MSHKWLKQLPNRDRLVADQDLALNFRPCSLWNFWQCANNNNVLLQFFFADLKRAFYHALLEQVVGPYFSNVDLRTYFPGWSDEDRREHTTRAMGNPLRAAGLSKAWTDLLRQWFTGGWFLVEGDAQPCLHDIGIKPGDTCAAAGFNLFFQQFQVVLRNRLRQLDLVTEIPFGQEGNFSDLTADELSGTRWANLC